MTKAEYSKCEKVMHIAIRKARQSREEYEKEEQHLKNGDLVEGEVAQRRADQHYGEAIGISNVLGELGFKHDKMKELHELL